MYIDGNFVGGTAPDGQWWGQHLVIDAYQCDNAMITNPDNIKAFLADLVTSINMVAYGDPQVVSFGSGDKAGYTFVQLIETSNIVGHCSNDLNTIFMDVFSCKPFDQFTVIELVKKYFNAQTFQKQNLWRGDYVVAS